MKKIIPISKPFFDNSDYNAVSMPVKSGWVAQGKYVEEFENKFRKFTGSKFAVAVSSCTAALHIAMRALDVKKGDEVILPAFTWISTANAIEECGGKPVFCDIDINTYNIDCEKIEKLINRNTKALLPVHLFGLSADMNRIRKISGNNHLRIVEDCACAFSSFYKGKHTGNFGDAGCFSFHPRKSITTGEGGMIVTDNKKIYGKLRTLRNIGCSIKPAESSFLLPEYDELGYNYRMTDIQGALGISQLNKAKKIIDYKMKLAEYYNEIFGNSKIVKIPFRHKDYSHSYQSYVLFYNPDNLSIKELMKDDKWIKYNEGRNYIMNSMMEQGINTRPGTHSAAHTQLYSGKYNITGKDYPASFLAEKLSLALPFYYGLTKKDQEYIFNNFLKYNKSFFKFK